MDQSPTSTTAVPAPVRRQQATPAEIEKVESVEQPTFGQFKTPRVNLSKLQLLACFWKVLYEPGSHMPTRTKLPKLFVTSEARACRLTSCIPYY